MKEKLEKLMKVNRRVYMEVGSTICLYTKEMLKKNEFMFCANDYDNIHELVQDLRKLYLVNYIKGEDGRLLIRNFKTK